MLLQAVYSATECDNALGDFIYPAIQLPLFVFQNSKEKKVCFSSAF